MAKKINNYVDNELLYEELVKYKIQVREAAAAGEPRPGVNNYIGKAILLIATNFGKRSQFSGYSYLDEMIDDAVENCIRYIHNFNEEKYKNPHAYITMTVFRAFINRIKKEKREVVKKFKALENSMIFNEGSNLSNEDAAVFQKYYTAIQKEISGQIIENNETKKKAPVKKVKEPESTSNTLLNFIGDENEQTTNPIEHRADGGESIQGISESSSQGELCSDPGEDKNIL